MIRSANCLICYYIEPSYTIIHLHFLRKFYVLDYPTWCIDDDFFYKISVATFSEAPWTKGKFVTFFTTQAMNVVATMTYRFASLMYKILATDTFFVLFDES